MSCLKTVWKEGQNCSNSNRYISGTNCNFYGFLHHDPGNNAFKAVMKKQEYDLCQFDFKGRVEYPGGSLSPEVK